ITTLSSNPPKTSLYSTDGLLNGCSLSSLISLSTLISRLYLFLLLLGLLLPFLL
ncbi:uncharacterized protein K441DRAFT_667679, partial [Cenococcum geophilum 1.58]|uniref:uncharacterized protein n=1 Tax=Cenococcum geophilum 1.58 TaxID=794803 RepID=UPI00358E14DE